MSLLVLQLSDIHFQVHRKYAATRVDKIVAASLAGRDTPRQVLIILSGDIAFAGRREEYAISSQFCEQLKAHFCSRLPGVPVDLIVVPGNHDCDYSVPEASTRELIIGTLLSNPAKLSAESDPLRILLSVQENFNEFETKLGGRFPPKTTTERVFRTAAVEVNGLNVHINIFNTSLGCMRRLDVRETDQGRLFFPTHFLDAASTSTDDTYTISVLHHPLNWLESNNDVHLRSWLKSNTDLVLLGHQHEEEAEAKDWISKEKNLWVRAAALQDGSGSKSGFNIIEVDPASLRETVCQYSWNGFNYEPSIPRVYEKSEQQRAHRRQIPLRDKMVQFINDVGTGYTHPTKKPLKLSDVYVTPQINELVVPEGTSKIGVDENLTLTFKLTILVGDARSGKTTLLKQMFKGLYDGADPVTPLMMDGTDIDASHTTLARLQKLLERSFRKQYGERFWQRFSQLAPQSKVIFIDNWQGSRLNDAGKADLLSLLSKQYERIVLFADDTFKLEESASYTNSFADLGQLAAYKIAPCGFFLRGKLIRKWLTFGREATISHQDLMAQINAAERTLDTILGRSLLPAYPVFVLALLQTQANIGTSNHANGSYGYLYESLIISALAEVSRESSEIDIYYTVLGRIAWELFVSRKSSVTGFELNEIISAYGEEYKAIVDPSLTANNLIKAKLIASSDGSYWFRYKYIYYFFVARFLADRLKTPSLREESKVTMLGLVDSITSEESANVIIFLIYLTRDADLLDRLAAKARSLFNEADLFNAESHVEFLSPKVERVIKGRTRVVRNAPEQNRDEERRMRDQVDLEASEDREESNPYEGPDSQFAQAIKIMDILGQAVRNFPGSMPGDIKVHLTAEVYRLGLRLMHQTISSINENMPETREFLKRAVRGKANGKKKYTDEELEKRVDAVVVLFAAIVCIGVTRKISSAVGLGQLKKIYEEVRESLGESAAVKLIDVDILLNHDTEFPRGYLLKLCEQFDSKWFARLILRELVAYHFSMFHVERGVAKSIGSKLGIDMQDPKIINQLAVSR